MAARRELLPDDFLSGVLYASDQVHHSVAKAAMLAGFPEKNVRVVPSDAAYRIRLDALATAVAADRAAGERPFLVVGSAGTTNTGAVDDLEGLAELCARERLWLHVDAAYGGFFLLTEEGRRTLAGISRADSVVLDPHKGLFLPYGTGSLLVRNRDTLRRAHALSADYMPPMQDDPDLVDFNLVSPELSRDWRGLRVWLPIAMHGIAPFRRNLEEKLELTRWATEELRKMPGVEIVAEPQLSIVAFRLTRPDLDTEEERAQPRVLAAINARKRVYLTGTCWDPFRPANLRPFLPHARRSHSEGLDDVRSAAEKSPCNKALRPNNPARPVSDWPVPCVAGSRDAATNYSLFSRSFSMRKPGSILALGLVLLLGLAAGATAQTTFTTTLRGAEEVPGPGDPDASGFATVTVQGTTITYSILVNGITTPTMAHIHSGVFGAVRLVNFNPRRRGCTSGKVTTRLDLISRSSPPVGVYVNVPRLNSPTARSAVTRKSFPAEGDRTFFSRSSAS